MRGFMRDGLEGAGKARGEGGGRGRGVGKARITAQKAEMAQRYSSMREETRPQ